MSQEQASGDAREEYRARIRALADTVVQRAMDHANVYYLYTAGILDGEGLRRVLEGEAGSPGARRETLEHRDPDCTGTWAHERAAYRCSGCGVVVSACTDVRAAVATEAEMGKLLVELVEQGKGRIR